MRQTTNPVAYLLHLTYPTIILMYRLQHYIGLYLMKSTISQSSFVLNLSTSSFRCAIHALLVPSFPASPDMALPSPVPKTLPSRTTDDRGTQLPNCSVILACVASASRPPAASSLESERSYYRYCCRRRRLPNRPRSPNRPASRPDPLL